MSDHSWLVGVLDDLDAYAKKNELHWLSKELSKTKVIAEAEISREDKVVRLSDILCRAH